VEDHDAHRSKPVSRQAGGLTAVVISGVAGITALGMTGGVVRSGASSAGHGGRGKSVRVAAAQRPVRTSRGSRVAAAAADSTMIAPSSFDRDRCRDPFSISAYCSGLKSGGLSDPGALPRGRRPRLEPTRRDRSCQRVCGDRRSDQRHRPAQHRRRFGGPRVRNQAWSSRHSPASPRSARTKWTRNDAPLEETQARRQSTDVVAGPDVARTVSMRASSIPPAHPLWRLLMQTP